MFEEIHRCETSFFRTYIQHYASGIKSSDLIAGSHIAKACELVRTKFFNEDFTEEDAINLGMEYILCAEDTGHSVKSNENTAYCLRKYFQKFKLEDSLQPAKLIDGTVAVEYKFDFDLGIQHPDLPDRNISFTGRLDFIGMKQSIQRTTYHGLDEKTCSSVFKLEKSKFPDYKKELARYRTNSQIFSYSWAAQQLGITLEDFIIRRIPITAEFQPSFELTVPVTQFAIDMWYKSTKAKIYDLVEKYKLYKTNIEGTKRSLHEVFYPSLQEAACLSYSRPCRYFEGCVSKEGELLLQEQFEQKIYNRDKRIEVPLDEYLRGLENDR